MLKPRTILTLAIAMLIAKSAAAAPAAKASIPSVVNPVSVHDHVAQIDGPVLTLTGPTGRSVAAWAYRSGGEFDLAVSVREADSTMFGAPVFFGRGNRADETDPALAFDASGAAYLAYSMPNPSRIGVSVLLPGTTEWSLPVVVSGVEVASSPSLLVLGNRLIVGFRTPRGTGLVDLPIASEIHADGIEDGPDLGAPLVGVKNKPLTSDTSPNPNP